MNYLSTLCTSLHFLYNCDSRNYGRAPLFLWYLSTAKRIIPRRSKYGSFVAAFLSPRARANGLLARASGSGAVFQFAAFVLSFLKPYPRIKRGRDAGRRRRTILCHPRVGRIRTRVAYLSYKFLYSFLIASSLASQFVGVVNKLHFFVITRIIYFPFNRPQYRRVITSTKCQILPANLICKISFLSPVLSCYSFFLFALFLSFHLLLILSRNLPVSCVLSSPISFTVSLSICVIIEILRAGYDKYEKNAYLFITLTDCTLGLYHIDRWTSMVGRWKRQSRLVICFEHRIIHYRNVSQKWCVFINPAIL